MEEKDTRAQMGQGASKLVKDGKETPKRGAELSPSPPLAESEGQSGDLFGEVEELRKKTKSIPLPALYRQTRAVALSTSGIWEAFIKEAKRKHPEEAAQISEGDFRAFDAAIKKTVFNQSRYYGNTKTNAGIRGTEYRETEEGEIKILPNIIVSLNELCREGFGVERADSKTRDKFRTLIELLKDTPIRFENEHYVLESYLCTVQHRLVGKTKKNNPETYWLTLNNIYCANISKSYANLRQNHIKTLRQNLKQIMPHNWRLLDLLTIQDKREPFTRYMESREEGGRHIAGLVEILGMEARYRKDRGRTEREIFAAIEAEIKTGLLLSYEPIRDARGKYLDKIIFHFNPDYTKAKGQTEDPEE